MIATIVVQHPRRMPSRSETHCSRDSNSAAAPLPIIPRRPSRSHSVPSHSLTRQSLTPTDCRQITDDSDSSSSNTSEESKLASKGRRRRVRGVRPGALSPPRTHPPLSSPEKFTNPLARPCQPQVKAVPTKKSEGNASNIAAPRPLMYVPGMLRLSVETMRSHMLAGPHPHDTRSTLGNGCKSAPPEGRFSEGPRLIRKKSGQPVKPSLKTPRSSTRGNLSVITLGSSSKSEPPTPTHKAVHFDTKEHVKLFLAEQKPLAVSRDGSPTEDTSGTDSDFPSFIYGSDEEQRPRKRLVMRPINMPSKPHLDDNVLLEDFYLNFDGTNILGKIRVRNLAYVKNVVVRFTFDSWQTTSEVTARYAETISPRFDRFSFSIRLNDLLARLEGKTFIMAIRYNVTGQEFWDNNNYQNYVATFTKAKVRRESRRSDDEDASDVENLRNKLEQVILQEKENCSLPSAPKKLHAMRSNETDPPCFKSSASLASRYDFAASFRNTNTWRPSDDSVWHAFSGSSQPQRDEKVMLPPLSPSSIPWPEKRESLPRRSAPLPLTTILSETQPLLGSPRDIADEELLTSASHIPLAELGDSSRDNSPHPSARSRNHHRGYFDGGAMGTGSAVKRTPPGTPPSKFLELNLSAASPIPSPASSIYSPSRYHSFPPLMANDSSFGFEFAGATAGSRNTLAPPSLSHDFRQGMESSGESELSTPSLASPTSSRSTTPSPTDAFTKLMLPPVDSSESGPEAGMDLAQVTGGLQPVSPVTHYRQFLSKFCFFTGPSVGRDPADIRMSAVQEAVPRSDSETNAQVSSSQQTLGGAGVAIAYSVDVSKASESMGDPATAQGDSGASTPTYPAGLWRSRSGTPVPS